MSMFESLKAPFAPDKISWRVGATTKDKENPKGLALCYIDARDVMERLDEVCGVQNWQVEYQGVGDGMLTCRIGINITPDTTIFNGMKHNEACNATPIYTSVENWRWKGDGAGGREASAGLAEQDANKGNFSDAFKRAAVMWGIGRYLYDIKSPWVEIDQYKRIKDSEMNKLRKIFPGSSASKDFFDIEELLQLARSASLQGGVALDTFLKSISVEEKNALRPHGKSLRDAADARDLDRDLS